jgi:hypothetical protein
MLARIEQTGGDMMTTAIATDWPTIRTLLESFGGQRGWRNGSCRAWYVPSPTGGTFTVEVTLRPRWCSLAIDRWRTTDRDLERAEPWFTEHVWPLVQAAIGVRHGWGSLPGGKTFAAATPVERKDLLELIQAWVPQELTWGLPSLPIIDSVL